MSTSKILNHTLRTLRKEATSNRQAITATKVEAENLAAVWAQESAFGIIIPSSASSVASGFRLDQVQATDAAVAR